MLNTRQILIGGIVGAGVYATYFAAGLMYYKFWAVPTPATASATIYQSDPLQIPTSTVQDPVSLPRGFSDPRFPPDSAAPSRPTPTSRNAQGESPLRLNPPPGDEPEGASSGSNSKT